MNAESILKTDLLDIVFENRNKEYGAYALRKFYRGRVKRSLLLVFLMVTVFCVYAVLPSKTSKLITVIKYEDPAYRNVKPPEKPAEKIVKNKPSPRANTQKLTSSIVIAKPKDSVAELKDLTELVKIGSTDFTGGVDDPPLETTEASGADNAKALKLEATKSNETVEAADIQPQFPGGINALRNFLERNLQNPKELEDGEIVAVKVKFIVGYDGMLQRFEIVQDGGTVFNNEVIRVLKKMPGWIPGKANGKNVSVYYTIPVKFVAND